MFVYARRAVGAVAFTQGDAAQQEVLLEVGPFIAVWIFGALGNALGLANLSTQLLQVIIGIVLVASVLLTNFLARPGGRVRASSPGRGATKEFRREPVRTTGFEKGRN